MIDHSGLMTREDYLEQSLTYLNKSNNTMMQIIFQRTGKTDILMINYEKMYISIISKAYNEICNEEYHGELSPTSGRFVVVLSLQITKVMHCVLSGDIFVTERTLVISFVVDMAVKWVFRFPNPCLMFSSVYVLAVVVRCFAAHRIVVTEISVHTYLGRNMWTRSNRLGATFSTSTTKVVPMGPFLDVGKPTRARDTDSLNREIFGCSEAGIGRHCQKVRDLVAVGTVLLIG